MRIETDEYGYIYVITPNGEKRSILVDMPFTTHYGVLKLGEPIAETCNKTEDNAVNASIKAKGDD